MKFEKQNEKFSKLKKNKYSNSPDNNEKILLIFNFSKQKNYTENFENSKIIYFRNFKRRNFYFEKSKNLSNKLSKSLNSKKSLFHYKKKKKIQIFIEEIKEIFFQHTDKFQNKLFLKKFSNKKEKNIKEKLKKSNSGVISNHSIYIKRFSSNFLKGDLDELRIKFFPKNLIHKTNKISYKLSKFEKIMLKYPQKKNKLKGFIDSIEIERKIIDNFSFTHRNEDVILIYKV